MATESAFRVIEAILEPVHRAERMALLGACRRYHAKDGFQAFVPEPVIDRMVAMGHDAEPNEWIGILVGRLGRDARGTYVIVDGVIPDELALATPGTVRSTSAGERDVRDVAATVFPGSIVIGWGHGHLRYGTRFSGSDRDNQATWTTDYALGIVCDPWSDESIGVYRGPKSERLEHVPLHGGTEPSRGMDALVMPGRCMEVESSAVTFQQPKRVAENCVPHSRRSNRRRRGFAVLAVLIAALVAVWLSRALRDIRARLDLLERHATATDNRASGDADATYAPIGGAMCPANPFNRFNWPQMQ